MTAPARDARLDPQIAGMLQMLDSIGAPPMSQGTVEQARQGFWQLTVGIRNPATLPPVASAEDTTYEAAEGPRRARVYRPEGVTGPAPTVLFVHGGGFVIGDVDTHEDQARLVCAEAKAVVVSIDYRLAPEHPFPAAYDDTVAALRWVHEHVGELGGDAARIAVAGDSAGGNLAAGAAQAARDHGIPLAAQLLIYPATDFATHRPSRDENALGYFLTLDDMHWFAQQYVGTTDAEAALAKDPRVSPLFGDLSGLAPAVVGVAQFDPLRDEGLAYAEALQQAGVRVVVRRGEGLIHGFYGFGLVSPAAKAEAGALAHELGVLLGSIEA